MGCWQVQKKRKEEDRTIYKFWYIKTKLMFTEQVSAIWQALVHTVSDVFPAPRWSTPLAEMQHPPGRSWSLWCWWTSPPWVRWAPPSVWKSLSLGTRMSESPDSHVTRTESAWWGIVPDWAPRAQDLSLRDWTHGLRGAAWADSSPALQTHCLYRRPLFAFLPSSSD